MSNKIERDRFKLKPATERPVSRWRKWKPILERTGLAYLLAGITVLVSSKLHEEWQSGRIVHHASRHFPFEY